MRVAAALSVRNQVAETSFAVLGGLYTLYTLYTGQNWLQMKGLSIPIHGAVAGECLAMVISHFIMQAMQWLIIRNKFLILMPSTNTFKCGQCGNKYKNWEDFIEHIKIFYVSQVLRSSFSISKFIQVTPRV